MRTFFGVLELVLAQAVQQQQPKKVHQLENLNVRRVLLFPLLGILKFDSLSCDLIKLNHVEHSSSFWKWWACSIIHSLPKQTFEGKKLVFSFKKPFSLYKTLQQSVFKLGQPKKFDQPNGQTSRILNKKFAFKHSFECELTGGKWWCKSCKM